MAAKDKTTSKPEQIVLDDCSETSWEDTHEELKQAHSADSSGGSPPPSTQKTRCGKRRWAIGGVLVLVFVAIAIALGVTLTKTNDNGGSSSAAADGNLRGSGGGDGEMENSAPADSEDADFRDIPEATHPNKTSWPELVGMPIDQAIEIIYVQRPDLQVIVVSEDALLQLDYNTGRVWLKEDENGLVAQIPRVG